MSNAAALRARWGRPDQRFWKRVSEATTGCWLWLGRTMRGYGYFFVSGRDTRVHRYSFELHFGDIPEGLGVLHKCDVKNCVRPDHLYAGTQKENVRDAIERGLTRAPRPKLALSDRDVRRARSMWRRGLMAQDIANEFGVDRHCISRALQGIGRYAEVPGGVKLRRGGYR